MTAYERQCEEQAFRGEVFALEDQIAAMKADLKTKKLELAALEKKNKQLDRGPVTYTREKPCLRGHTGPRYIKGDRCLECIKEVYGRDRDHEVNKALEEAATAMPLY